MILSKEEVGEIIDITEEMCNLDGWVPEALPLAQKRMDIIVRAESRPDPLALLEAQIRREQESYENKLHKLPKHLHDKGLCLASDSSTCGVILDMIDLLRTNSEAVLQQGIKEGWWIWSEI